MAVSDTLINTLFDGRYRIIRKLGSGGMANVYLAEDQELGRRVAIKILNERHAGDEQFIERFRREAKNAASLSHPNIVSIYDRGEAEGTYYIAMEYLDGRTLKELILTRGPAPVNVAIEYARQILAALRFAHRNGLVHRDIKPHNVLVDSEGRLKVTDFGIARSGASQMTEAGSIIGTAQYLSPEQAQGAQVDQTSDLYSVGIVLYELLTGTVPFTGDTPVEIAMKHLSRIPEPPSTLRPDVPPDLDLLVMRALAKHREDRYQNAEEMDADLARVARGVAVAPETEEAATAIMSAPTTVTGVLPPRAPVYQPPQVYYDYEEQARRPRPLWPWLLLLVLAVVGAAGYYIYTQIQDQLNATKPVAVPYVEGLRAPDAAKKVRDAGLKPQLRERPDAKTQPGFVFDQDPAAGERIDKGNTVTIFVSTGKPQTTVPKVVGMSSTDAAAALATAHLRPNAVSIHSDKPPNTVIAQAPRAGDRVDQGTTVRINISSGPAPVAVPPVIGEPFESASSRIQGVGLAVARKDVNANQPAGTVVDQNPSANSLVAPNTVVTLSVSKGPTTTTVPDVTSQDRDTAISNLKASGFKVKVVEQPTTDPNQDGFVLDQNPAGATPAKPGSTVTIFVGKLATPPTTPTTP